MIKNFDLSDEEIIISDDELNNICSNTMMSSNNASISSDDEVFVIEPPKLKYRYDSIKRRHIVEATDLVENHPYGVVDVEDTYANVISKTKKLISQLKFPLLKIISDYNDNAGLMRRIDKFNNSISKQYVEFLENFEEYLDEKVVYMIRA